MIGRLSGGLALSDPSPGASASAPAWRAWPRALRRSMRWLIGSMLGQMLLLTMLFVGCGVYVFAIEPMMSIPPLTAPDPMELTLAKVEGVIDQALINAEQPGHSLQELRSDPVLAEVKARNPDFRYYVLNDHGHVGTQSKADYYQSLGLDRMTQLHRDLRETAPCTNLSRDISNPPDHGYLSYGDCSTLRYYEFGGIRTPLSISVPPPLQTYTHWFWSYSQPFLVPALGVFLIGAVILLLNISRIRRIARLAQRAENGSEPFLPEKGLPTEVVPLVRAVNSTARLLAETHAHQRFFLSAAAHEMRTPLTVLRTRIEILEEGEIKQKLIRDTRRLTDLSESLLTLMSVNARAAAFEPVDLSKCCTRVLSQFEGLARQKDIELRFREPASAQFAMAEQSLVRIALTNFVTNAIAHSPPGSEIVMTLDDERRISVRDFGIGLKKDDIASLFEPFVRDTATYAGHGLGLAIVQAIALRHGAVLDARNARDGGAIFSIRFPAID